MSVYLRVLINIDSEQMVIMLAENVIQFQHKNSPRSVKLYLNVIFRRLSFASFYKLDQTLFFMELSTDLLQFTHSSEFSQKWNRQ